MHRREIPLKISDLLPDHADRSLLERFVAEAVPNDGGKVHIALISALSVRRRAVRKEPLYESL